MLLIPSIDLRGGRCVRLLRGDFDAETRYDSSPEALLEGYAAAGARWLHVVDLDGARDGVPANLALVRRLSAQSGVRIQFGGGLRTALAIDAALDAGVARIVIGSAAVENPALLRECFARLDASRLCLAIDVRADASGVARVRTRGWTEESPLSLWELLDSFADTPLQHVLCTDVERDGAMSGPNLALYEEAQRRAPHIQWQASGGVRDAADLAALASLGLAAAISGKALLEGRIRREELQPYLPGA